MDEPNWPQEIASTPVVHINLLESTYRHIPSNSNKTRCRQNQYEFIHFHCDSIWRHTHTFACETNARAALPYSRRQSTETI